MKNEIIEEFRKSVEVKLQFGEKNSDKIIEVIEVIIRAFKNGNKLLLFGNGGSAACAQHLAAEFVNRFLIERSPLPALSLTTDTSIITSIANDYGFSNIFSKQIEALGKRGDIAFAFTTSGKSLNIIEAFKAAKNRGLINVGLTGKDGGEVLQLADYWLNVESDNIPVIQEIHVTLGHIICRMVEKNLYGAP